MTLRTMILCAVAPALLGLVGALVLLVVGTSASASSVALWASVAALLTVIAAVALLLRLATSSAVEVGRLVFGAWSFLDRVADYFPPPGEPDPRGQGGPGRPPIDVLFEDPDLDDARPVAPTGKN